DRFRRDDSAQRSGQGPPRRGPPPLLGDRDAANLIVTMVPSLNAFRESMARLAATVHIVTAEAEGQRHGMTMTAACSLSVDPMSMILSIDRGSATHGAIIA